MDTTGTGSGVHFKDTNQKSELANQTSYFEMGFTQEEVLTKFHHCHVYSLCIN